MLLIVVVVWVALYILEDFTVVPPYYDPNFKVAGVD